MSTITDFAAKRGGLFYPKADQPASRVNRGPETVYIDESLLAESCRNHLGKRPKSIEKMNYQGTRHAIFRITMPDGDQVIARVDCDNEEPGYQLLLDQWIASKLRLRSIPVLEVFAVDLKRRYLPYDCSFMAMARGRTLREHDEDETSMIRLLNKLGAYLAELHQISVQGAGLLAGEIEWKGSCKDWSTYLNNHLYRHLKVCRTIEAIDENESSRIEKIFENRISDIGNRSGKLLHGDPGNHNVFVNEERINCLIDWEDALAGDPVYEVAFWATFHPQRRFKAFFSGYIETLGNEIDNFDDRFWLYYLRIALAKTVVRSNLGIKDRPDRPKPSRRIQQGLIALEQRKQAA